MKNLEFPIIGTKVKGLNQKFDLDSPAKRKKYFKAKAGDEIEHLKKYMKKGTFIAYFLGKKSAGKGTYSKLFTEIFGEDKVAHVSVGDVVRDVYERLSAKKRDNRLYEELRVLYRGYISYEDAVDALVNKTQDKLLPTEFILATLKHYIAEHEGKSIFIDGLPRDLDQISYSLYFRDLINYRNDPDFFVLIDIPESVIAERMRYRAVCPKCQTSRNTKLFVTSKVEYDEKRDKYYLVCDNETCEGARMVSKEGDTGGLELVRERLDRDEGLIKKAFELHGIPKILLRNHVSVKDAKKYFDEYELTPAYSFDYNKKTKKVKIKESYFSVKDDNGVESYSLLAPPVLVSLLKQMVEVLDI